MGYQTINIGWGVRMRRFNNNQTRGRKPQPQTQEQIKNAVLDDLMKTSHNNTAQGAARAIFGAVLKVMVCLCCNCCCACVVVARSTRNRVCAEQPIEVRCCIM